MNDLQELRKLTSLHLSNAEELIRLNYQNNDKGSSLYRILESLCSGISTLEQRLAKLEDYCTKESKVSVEHQGIKGWSWISTLEQRLAKLEDYCTKESEVGVEHQGIKGWSGSF